MYVTGIDVLFVVERGAISDGLACAEFVSGKKHYKERSPELEKFLGNSLCQDQQKKDHISMKIS